MVLSCCLQARRQPEIDPQSAPGWNSDQDERLQHQQAIRPDPFSIGQALVQLQGEHDRQDGPKRVKSPNSRLMQTTSSAVQTQAARGTNAVQPAGDDRLQQRAVARENGVL